MDWFKKGLWFHDKKGVALVYPKDGYKICVDKNITKPHPIFRVKLHVVEELTGEYFFKRSLKDYEFIGEDDFSLPVAGENQ